MIWSGENPRNPRNPRKANGDDDFDAADRMLAASITSNVNNAIDETNEKIGYTL